MSKILKDIQGFKYIVLELKLNELETMFSERHRAILVVEKDMRKLSGGFYEFPDLIEIQEKEKTTQYGIVQKINVETMEELLKAYLSIKEIGWIKDKENLEGLELIINKEKIKEAEEKKKKLSIKQKEVKEVQKTIFGDVKEEEAEVEDGEDIEEETNDNDCESDFFNEEEE